ncbi:phosphonoacetaldehyde hydrolase [Candidatus Formimonas warabiya]|uniref:Phosphonoacetaldehyde hydrolase n=1 Tax=Formimonas warabiya TaxID=1761012 RepID=A0A3G1KW78_FORW1|nr:phosphonoacetaldehyde hydrolase [Candidatus Formimonas warabiya]ATW26647.1 phosphonoacetaldehyde hydrolase [Candidatus Formimonas warabiya]
MNKIKAVVFDWAGTAVDYGCFAPLHVFEEVFLEKGIEITGAEARGPMGMRKIDHIRALCQMERISQAWKELFGRQPDEGDVRELYGNFEPMLLQILPGYTDPVPGVVELVSRLRDRGIKIGSTTGYSAKMMEIVTKEAARKGYQPDLVVTPDEVPAGRPYPWMCFQNAIRLGVYPMSAMAKVGDTVSDIREGINAGMWSIGVIKGGSELGLSQTEVKAMKKRELKEKINEVSRRFKEAGAHYVVKEIGEVFEIIEDIEKRLKKGALPNAKNWKKSS